MGALAKGKTAKERPKSQSTVARADLTDDEIRQLINELVRRLSGIQKTSLLYLFYPDNVMMLKRDAIMVYNLFRSCGPIDDLTIFLHSGGGDIATAYDIVNLCRQYTKNGITVMVPQWGMSAATLVALGSDSLVMSKIAKLGPLDPVTIHPQFGWLPVRAITDVPKVLEEELHKFKGGGGDLAPREMMSLKSEAIIKPMAEQANPYLHAAYMRTSEIAKIYGEKVFAAKKVSKERAAKCLEHLITVYPIHGYELDARELQENVIFKDVINVLTPSKEQENHMMDLLMAFVLLDQKHRQRGEETRNPMIDLVLPAKSPRAMQKQKKSPKQVR